MKYSQIFLLLGRQNSSTGVDFIIKNIDASIDSIMRQIGYSPAYFQKAGEYSMVKKLGGNDYPRFHAYIKEIASALPRNDGGGKALNFSLHLDQKKPSYEGSTGHSGDYDGPAVENEVERIKDLVSSL